MKHRRNNSGITIMAIMLIVFSICAATTVGLFFMHKYGMRQRDKERKSDLATLVDAIERYNNKYGHYPIGEGLSTDPEWGKTGVQTIGNPLGVLVDLNFLSSLPRDPVNTTTGCSCGQGFAYYYCHFEPGSGQTCVRDASDNEVLSHNSFHLSTCLEESTAACQVESGGVISALGNYRPN